MVVGREGRGCRGIGGGMLCEIGVGCDATGMRCDALAPRGWAFATSGLRWEKVVGAIPIYLNRAPAGNEVRFDL